MIFLYFIVFFFFNDTATTEIYTLSLHDALPISPDRAQALVDPKELVALEEPLARRPAFQAREDRRLEEPVLAPGQVEGGLEDPEHVFDRLACGATRERGFRPPGDALWLPHERDGAPRAEGGAELAHVDLLRAHRLGAAQPEIREVALKELGDRQLLGPRPDE